MTTRERSERGVRVCVLNLISELKSETKVKSWRRIKPGNKPHRVARRAATCSEVLGVGAPWHKLCGCKDRCGRNFTDAKSRVASEHNDRVLATQHGFANLRSEKIWERIKFKTVIASDDAHERVLKSVSAEPYNFVEWVKIYFYEMVWCDARGSAAIAPTMWWVVC